MPWIEGGSLADRIKERRAGLPPQEVVDVAVQLLEGLRDLHDRGVVHGKVTPGNALVDERGIVMLADYGLASVVGNAIGSLPWVRRPDAEADVLCRGRFMVGGILDAVTECSRRTPHGLTAPGGLAHRSRCPEPARAMADPR